jgi:hypothetical protein
MTRLPLGQVTLCAVECKAPALAAQSLLQSMRHAAFGRVCLFTHDWLPAVVLPGIEIIDIEAIRTPAEQSQFVIRVLPHHVRTSHALLTRWDAFVVNPAAWTDEFLVHDFVGAPWPDRLEGREVGQGAFSLRSRRFLRAGADPRLTEEHPEDEVLCERRRDWMQDVHGISYAPAALARRFVADDDPVEPWHFGCLGAQHLPGLHDEDDMGEVVARLPREWLLGEPASRLAKALLMRGMPAVAQSLLLRRQQAGSTDELDSRLLGAAASVLGKLMPGG